MKTVKLTVEILASVPDDTDLETLSVGDVELVDIESDCEPIPHQDIGGAETVNVEVVK